ncbi:hypothetical protein AB0903_28200 [Streptomyces sp. NPDC048389]|uniref:hypothetical protein n=1 Tax=Streptomyces sp. NPDC048389 TaxID=3154622 RepID=UPI003453ACA5
MSDLDTALDSLQCAATGLVTDFADVLVRGCLKEHPDLVAYRLAVLSGAIDKVHALVLAERAGSQWAPLPADPAAAHATDTAQVTHHRCTCPFCLHGD